jgi:hypothetical protein
MSTPTDGGPATPAKPKAWTCANCGALDFYACGCYDRCHCGHDRRSHLPNRTCTHVGCECRYGLHGTPKGPAYAE